MQLTQDERDVLVQTLNTKRPEILEARMANALLLLSEGLSTEDVAGLLYLDEANVEQWKRLFTLRSAVAAR